MIDCDIVPALQEIIISRPPTNIIADILHSIQKEMSSHIVESQLDIDALAFILHQIYISHDINIRASVLNFCRKLEECSLSRITEKYMFDYLISQSLGQKIPLDMENATDCQLAANSGIASSDQIQLNRSNHQVQSHQNFHQIHHIFNCCDNFSKKNVSGQIEFIDEEKLACFKYIELLIKKCGHLSPAVIRSLVALYESDFAFHEGCKPSVIYLLAQSSINFTGDQKYLMPSVLRVFSSYLFKDATNMTIPALFAYSIENGLPLIYDDLFLMEFFWPLSNYSLFLESKKKTRRKSRSDPDNINFSRIEHIEGDIHEKTENAKQALIFFLRTWPGLLYFGIKNKAIEYLMICMAYKPTVIIDILRSLLNLKENTSSVTDGYSGFLLAELLKLGLIEKLNQRTSIFSQNALLHSKEETSSPSKARENNLPSSFSIFTSTLSSTRSASANFEKENSKITKSCEDFINEILPFTSHRLNNDNISTNYQVNQTLKPLNERKPTHRIFQRNSFLNSDADLEFYNMYSLLNINGDEYSSSVFSAPKNNNTSFKLNSDESFSRMIDVAQVITHKSSLISVNDVMGKKKDIDFMTIKWAEIQILLNVVLPYDQSEAAASSKLYTLMINFLSSNEFNAASPAKRIEMFEPYSSLLDLLLNGKVKDKCLEDNTKFKDLIVKTIDEIVQSKTVINYVNRNSKNNKPFGNLENRSDSVMRSPRSPMPLNNFSSTNSIPQKSMNKETFDMNSSKWFIFRLLMKIMSNSKGISILKKWKLDSNITTIGLKINNSQLADAILGEILFYPDASLAIPLFHSFLNSPNDDIPKYALSQLKILRRKLPNFIQQCFKPILIQHIKDLKPKEHLLNAASPIASKRTSKKSPKINVSLNTSLNFLGEIISTDEASLKTVCEDIELIRIIFNNSHLIFSLLLSREETRKTWDTNTMSTLIDGKIGSAEKNISLNEIRSSKNEKDSSSSNAINRSDRRGRRLSRENVMEGFGCITFDQMVDSEILRWMDTENLAYLRAFHTAVDATFSGTLEDAILSQPAIFVINDCAQPPPHLFGQLSKLPNGLKKLTPYIEELVNVLVTLIDNPNINTLNKNDKDKNSSESKDKNDDDNNANDSRSSLVLRNKSKRSRHGSSSPSKSVLISSKHGRVNSQIISRQAADENICSILFALAQFGSVPSTSDIVEELGIVEKMIQASVASPSYVVKGALISCLSLFAPSNYLSSILQRYKWQKFRFGNRTCIIPRKPRSLFRETAVKRLNVVTAANEESSNYSNYSNFSSSLEYSAPPIPKAPSSLQGDIKKRPPIGQNVPLKQSKTARQPSSSFDISVLSGFNNDSTIEDDTANLLLSIIFDPSYIKKLSSGVTFDIKDKDNSEIDDVNKNKNNLVLLNLSSISASNSSSPSIMNAVLEIQKKIGKPKINRNLKIWANKLISSYAVENNARDLINCLFEDISLMDLPENIENTISPENKLTITAKFNQFCKSAQGMYKNKSFKDVEPLVLSLDEIAKVKLPFPEASLTSKDFEKVTSMHQIDFYELPLEKKEEIRKKLRGE